MHGLPEAVGEVPPGAVLDHIGIAVRDLAAAGRTYSALLPGVFRLGPVHEVPAQGARVSFLTGAGTKLELVQPLNDSGPLARFLARRGEGMHHVCFAVPSIEAELARLTADGAELIDRIPRPGHGGRVAFVHPRTGHGVLLELLEREVTTDDDQA
ncbi:MAG: methylmalonyl-CoA epimerase [Dehalococcoidia bacterium]|nr:methylmalonyl-CoA epimerase [Dehalococcoidia bacterium]